MDNGCWMKTYLFLPFVTPRTRTKREKIDRAGYGYAHRFVFVFTIRDGQGQHAMLQPQSKECHNHSLSIQRVFLNK